MKTILKMLVPMSIATLINMILSFTDTAMVGTLGVNSLSATASANSLLAIFLQMISVLLIGFQIYASQAWREQNIFKINSYFKYTLFYMYVLSIGCIIISIIFSNQLLSLFTTPEILSESKKYFFSRLMSLVILPLILCMRASFDIRQLTKIGLYATILVVTSNIIFNYLLIFVLHLGVLGAGLGSTLAMLMSVIYLIFCNQQQGVITWSQLKNISLNQLAIHKELKAINLSEMLNMMLDYLGSSVLFIMLSYISVRGIAVGKVSNLYISTLFSLVMPLGTVIQILFNQTQDRQQRDTYLKSLFQISYLLISIFTFSMLVCPMLFVLPFTKDAQLMTMLKYPIMLVGIIAIFMPLLSITTGILRAYKKNKENMYINIFCVWFIQLPIAYLFCFILNYNGLGFVISFLCYFIVRSGLNLCFVRLSG